MNTWPYLTACVVAWGLALFLMKIAGKNIGPYTSVIFGLPGYFVASALVVKKADYHVTKWHFIPMCVAALYVFGNFAFYKLSTIADVSRIAPATSLYIAIPILLGWIVLKEPVTMQRLAGIALAGVALYLLTASENTVQP